MPYTLLQGDMATPPQHIGRIVLPIELGNHAQGSGAAIRGIPLLAMGKTFLCVHIHEYGQHLALLFALEIKTRGQHYVTRTQVIYLHVLRQLAVGT